MYVMKKTFVIVLTLIAVLNFQPPSIAVVSGALSTDILEDGELWFPVGEQLHYKLYWGLIPVGKAELISKWTVQDGKKLLVLQAKAKTNKVVEKLFAIDDFVESIVDPETFLPLEYTQRLNEGKKHTVEKVVFDHDSGVAHYSDELKEIERQIEIDIDTRDVLALTYLMRADGMDIDEKSDYKVLVDEKLWELELSALKDESVKLPKYGKVDCRKYEPTAQFGGIMNRKGSVKLWFSNDDRRLCAKVSGKVPLAHIHAVLTSVVGPGDDEWVGSEKKE